MWYKTENINLFELTDEFKNIVDFISTNINYYEGVSNIASGIGDIYCCLKVNMIIQK